MKKYTLIELLVAMGIFAFMMLLLMNFFSISTDLLGRETNRAVSNYEAGIFLSMIKTDLENSTINATYQWAYKDGGSGSGPGTNLNNIENQTQAGSGISTDSALRFFSYTYDNDGAISSSTRVQISYVYDSANYRIYRFAYPIVTVPIDFDDLENLSNNYGGIILEGVEEFRLMIYGNYATQEDYDYTPGSTSIPSTSSDGSFYTAAEDASAATGQSTDPDLINVYLKINDKNTLELPASVGKTNQLLQRRRQLSTQIPMAYN
ncbi:prepilin-type N-terminal cleavage/methylation domain-containing protein [Lentisphaera profundi]|uniref:Prepilin-type N-terminal cleavage/methylation domain-containing protein n=1 Tax=Lentisphaera profundi TaxID=1658616 RepID=A0ABY7VVC5_9BACT|nr:prepilin-type N-terminal cleavage/methylation domain-containing protein [Lentisphaera profundi]WDE98181.1 prepilin-type N-terminal cleavage/methylation domain-containing protein [Lentisphaera profundi]